MAEEKNVKDYLHLYLGCPCMVDGRPAIIDSVSTNKHIDTVTAQFTDTDDEYDWAVYNDLSEVKPLLRPLSDLTEQEGKHIAKMIFKNQADQSLKVYLNYLGMGFTRIQCYDAAIHIGSSYEKYYPEVFLYLLSKGFDLFELIPAGIAIDKTTLQTSSL